MMTFAKIKNEGKYYLDLAKEDYYLNGGEPDGIWCGAAALMLRLKGAVNPGQFRNTLKGYSPDGKSPLCQNPGKNHTSGWDLTFNAPKSFSLLWAVADNDLKKNFKQRSLMQLGMLLPFSKKKQPLLDAVKEALKEKK